MTVKKEPTYDVEELLRVYRAAVPLTEQIRDTESYHKAVDVLKEAVRAVDMPLYLLGLKPRTGNALIGAGLTTVSQVKAMTARQCMLLKNFSKVSLGDLEARLGAYDWELASEDFSDVPTLKVIDEAGTAGAAARVRTKSVSSDQSLVGSLLGIIESGKRRKGKGRDLESSLGLVWIDGGSVECWSLTDLERII